MSAFRPMLQSADWWFSIQSILEPIKLHPAHQKSSSNQQEEAQWDKILPNDKDAVKLLKNLFRDPKLFFGLKEEEADIVMEPIKNYQTKGILRREAENKRAEVQKKRAEEQEKEIWRLQEIQRLRSQSSNVEGRVEGLEKGKPYTIFIDSRK
jgi:hypothetical protein